MSKKLTLEQQVAEDHIQELFAFQYNDGSDVFTIRKSFSNLIDLDPNTQSDFVQEFHDGGFKNVSFADIRSAVFANCDMDREYSPN